jgi:hypothetical protein
MMLDFATWGGPWQVVRPSDKKQMPLVDMSGQIPFAILLFLAFAVLALLPFQGRRGP